MIDQVYAPNKKHALLDCCPAQFQVVLEHAFLLLKFCLGHILPDHPDWVRVRLIRQETQALESLEAIMEASETSKKNDREPQQQPLRQSFVQGLATRALAKDRTERGVATQQPSQLGNFVLDSVLPGLPGRSGRHLAAW